MGKGGPKRHVDALDLDIIRELEVNALASNAEISVKVSASPTTVRRRIQKLLDQRRIAITTIPDPVAFGYGTQATIVVNASGGKVNQVAAQLASFQNVRYVIVTTGRYDIFAEVILNEGMDSLYHFITVELPGLGGIRESESFMVMKAKNKWILPPDGLTQWRDEREAGDRK